MHPCLEKRSGSFAAPDVPSTFVVYSRIGNTDSYFIKWYEDTDISDTVRETLDLPGLLQRTEIIYDVPAIFAACDPDSGEITGILYKNDRYFSDCESLEDLGLTPEDLKKSGGKSSGKLKYDEVGFSYVSGESELPAGYVILLEPVPDLFAKAFVQAGYMIAVLIITVTTLLVAGFSFCPLCSQQYPYSGRGKKLSACPCQIDRLPVRGARDRHDGAVRHVRLCAERDI